LFIAQGWGILPRPSFTTIGTVLIYTNYAKPQYRSTTAAEGSKSDQLRSNNILQVVAQSLLGPEISTLVELLCNKIVSLQLINRAISWKFLYHGFFIKWWKL